MPKKLLQDVSLKPLKYTHYKNTVEEKAIEWCKQLELLAKKDPRIFSNGELYSCDNSGSVLKEDISMRSSLTTIYELARDGRLFLYGANEEYPRQVQVTADGGVGITDPFREVPKPEVVAKPQQPSFWRYFFYIFNYKMIAQYNEDMKTYEKYVARQAVMEKADREFGKHYGAFDKNVLSQKELEGKQYGYLFHVYPDAKNLDQVEEGMRALGKMEQVLESGLDVRYVGREMHTGYYLRSTLDAADEINQLKEKYIADPENAVYKPACFLKDCVLELKENPDLYGVELQVMGNEARKAFGPGGELSTAEARQTAHMDEREYYEALGLASLADIMKQSIQAQNEIWMAVAKETVPENMNELLAKAHLGQMMEINLSNNNVHNFLGQLGKDMDPNTMQSKSMMNELMDKLMKDPKVQSMQDSIRQKDSDAVANYLGSPKAMRNSLVQISMPKVKEEPQPEKELNMQNEQNKEKGNAMGNQPG